MADQSLLCSTTSPQQSPHNHPCTYNNSTPYQWRCHHVNHRFHLLEPRASFHQVLNGLLGKDGRVQLSFDLTGLDSVTSGEADTIVIDFSLIKTIDWSEILKNVKPRLVVISNFSSKNGLKQLKSFTKSNGNCLASHAPCLFAVCQTEQQSS